MMNVKEMIMALAKTNVLSVAKIEKDRIYVEDCESYVGAAYIYFDNDGNVLKVEEA